MSNEDAGLRLDQLIARHVADLSRGKAKIVLQLGGVFVDRKRVKVAGRVLRPGQRVEVHTGAVFARTVAAGEGAAADLLPAEPVVRHQDDQLIVVDKPSGVLSAPTPESDRGNLVSWLEARTSAPVHVVHRLDRPTSGLLVFARTSQAAARLGQWLTDHQITREYLLAVVRKVNFDQRLVDSAVRGKEARTEFECLERVGEVASLLRARLATGRTHQVRVHAAALGHPVCGDRQYGDPAEPAERAPRLALHATKLALLHPQSGRPLVFESPWPADLSGWWTRLAERAGQ